MENRPLARTIWSKVKVGKPIPGFLFQAVAEILAKVYRVGRQKAS
jgi:flagellar biosynthetic protein FlhB